MYVPILVFKRVLRQNINFGTGYLEALPLGEATYPFASVFPVIQKLLNIAIPLVLFFTTWIGIIIIVREDKS